MRAKVNMKVRVMMKRIFFNEIHKFNYFNGKLY